jgi:hypothetical protein
MPTKPWYASKTIWFNGVTIIVAIATFFGWTPDQAIASAATAFLVAASPFVNLALRFFTKQPIAPATPPQQ